MADKPPQFVMIDGYLVDVAIQEDHSFESEITDFPVESGGSFSDNIRPKPITVTVQGIVSDTPLTNILTERASTGRTTTNAVASADAYALLQKIWLGREPVTIRTSLALFTNMALSSLTIPKSKDSGAALHFTAAFQQIQVVTNKRVRVRTASPGAGKKRKLGPVSAVPRARNGELETVVWRMGAPPGGPDIYLTKIIFWERTATTAYAGSVATPRVVGGVTLRAATFKSTPSARLVHSGVDANGSRVPLSQTELRNYWEDWDRDENNRLFGRPLDPHSDEFGRRGITDSNGDIRLAPQPTKTPVNGMSKLVRNAEKNSGWADNFARAVEGG